MKPHKHLNSVFWGIFVSIALASCDQSPYIAKECITDGGTARSGYVKDEALCANRMAESFPAADEDYFKDMDYGVTHDASKVAAILEPYVPGISKTPQDAVNAVAKGRNNWIVWTGGNDKFWDHVNISSLGSFDLLKVLSNHPELIQKVGYSRDNRWNWFGLVNEPCFKKNVDAQGKLVGRTDRFGLFLDVREASCAADPFENEVKYPGVKIGARGDTVPVGSFYGYASGIVGLRIFPNPDFDEAARKRWDPVRYYTDPSYYNDKNLVRPYRVGMSCGFCHVGPNPSNPPKDPENPQWANLNSNPGAQYYWFNRIFAYEADKSSYAFQHLSTNRPGALDTSLVSTDYMNNPRTMNAVYNLGARMQLALKWGEEKLDGNEHRNKQFQDFSKQVPENSPLNAFYKKPNIVFTPRVLKDASDSVGALGALNRVFVNIGLFSEEWLQHIKPLVGGKPFTPFPIEIAQKNSTYWNATEQQTLDTALFFLVASSPDYLKNAPGGKNYLTNSNDILKRGKEAFVEHCAACHSSKLPEKAFQLISADRNCVGSGYLNCWNDYWKWTKTDEFKKEMTKIVMRDDFLVDNYLSSELRIPVTLLETNICASMATNALKGDTWDNFSSSSYKGLPSVGTTLIHHPVTNKPIEYAMPAGGRGYIRPPSLVSIWSTAPFLLNNTVGTFYPSGSVEDRMKSFSTSIEQLLWPEKRSCDQKDLYATYYESGHYGDKSGDATQSGYYSEGNYYKNDRESSNSCEGKTYLTKSGKQIPGIIDRTFARSWLRIPEAYLPELLQPLVVGGSVELLGPIPAGSPVNLISNIDLENKSKDAFVILRGLKGHIADLIKAKKNPDSVTDEELLKVYSDMVDPLLKVNKCPDFVVNRGHYFGTDYLPNSEGKTPLNDTDKRALIEFLKTL